MAVSSWLTWWRWARLLLVAILACGQVLLLGSSAAWSVEGAAQEAETVCTGGSVQTGQNASGGAWHIAPFTCALPSVTADTVLRFRHLHPNTFQNYACDFSLNGGVPVRSNNVGSVYETTFTLTLPAGTHTLTGATVNATYPCVGDFYTLDSPPASSPSPSPVASPVASPSPSPSPVYVAPSVMALDQGQFGVLIVAAALGLLFLAATFVAQMRRP